MLILAIDTSTRTGSVALLRQREVLQEISGNEDTPYSARLFRDIELLQSRAPFRMDQVELFAVACGPGSFTGLRVGLTAVKAWAEVHGKPVAAISGLEAVAAQSRALELGDGDIIAPFLDGRRGQLFGALYRRLPGIPNRLDLVAEDSVLSAEEFLDLVKGNSPSGRPTLVTANPDVLPVNLRQRILPQARVEIVSASLAPTIGRLGLIHAERGDLVNAMQLDANYVRRSDAEAAWKDA